MSEHPTRPREGSSTTARPSADPPGTGSLVRGAAAGALAALVSTSAVYAVSRAAGLDLVVTPPGGSADEVPYAALLGAVAVSSVVALVGALLFRGLPHGRRWYAVLGTVVVLGSLSSPIGAAEEPSTAAVLGVMHLLVGVCLLPVLARRMGATR